MNKVYLGLRANRRNRLGYLNRAYDIIEANENVFSIDKTDVYEDVYLSDENRSLYMGIYFETDRSEDEIISFCHNVEEKLDVDRSRGLIGLEITIILFDKDGLSSIDIESLLKNYIEDNCVNLREYEVSPQKIFCRQKTVKIWTPSKDKKINLEKDKFIIAGPCAIESYEQLIQTAISVKKSGANILRGGAFKPRTSHRSFSGLKKEGLEILKRVRDEVDIPVITELMDVRDLESVYDVADIIQIGSRNMQNFNLLQEVGKQDKPVMLKRGLSATIDEWICSAEYIAAEGNENIIMCERGIRTYNDYTRNTMDIAAIPVIKSETGLPIIADPSHATGKRSLIEIMSCASIVAGADGLMIEVHPDPDNALSDGDQSVTFDMFKNIMKKIDKIRNLEL